MRFTLVALVLGVAAGLLGGGRLANLGKRSFRLWPLLAVGGVLQVFNSPVTLTLSYLVLIAFAAANLRVPGFGLLVIGLALNAAVVVANGAMPVRADIAAVSGKHRAEEPGDRLRLLDDRLDLPPLGEVLSFGDLVLAVGLAAAAAALVRRPPEGRHAQLADESGAPRLR
jgi:hypothetical protein